MVIAVDMTVLGFALPRLSADLGPTSGQQLWIIDIYGFMLAGLLIIMGTLGDRVGRRRLLLVGAGAFGLASVAAAYAASPEQLIAARALLGIAGATLMPSTMSIIRTLFTDRVQRRNAIAIWSVGFSAGMAVGPIVGGWLLEHFWWGSVFLVNVPVMVLLLLVGPFLLPESRDPSPGRFDLLSAVLSLATVLPTVYGMKKLVAEGGDTPLPAAAIVVGLGFGWVFVRRQLRLPDPLLDLRLFQRREFSVSVGANLVVVFANAAAMFFLPQYLQVVLGMNALEASLWLLPAALASVTGSLLAARLAARFTLAGLISAGLALGAAGYAALIGIGVDTGLALAVTGVSLEAFGAGLAMTLTNDVVIATAPPERAGAAAAMSETGTEFGGALGTAVLGAVAAAVYRSEMSTADPALTAARDTLGGAVETARHLPPEAATTLLDQARQAFTHGLQLTMVAGALILAAAATAVLTVLRTARVTTSPGHDD
ncbi:MFS transporter [Crossiella equi]|nr:MFS transporter [Crossiella equi]